MTKDINKHPALPKVPTPINKDTNTKKDDYYIQTQVNSTLPKYSGKGKGLDIFLQEDDYKKLIKLQDLFGEGFDANHTINAGFKFIESERISKNWPPISNKTTEVKNLKIKPNKDSLTAILKIGRENSASILASIGIQILFERLLPILEKNKNEYL